MDEYLNEQEQWEEVKAWVREGWPWFLGAVVVVAGGWAGWKAWLGHRETQYAAAATQYELLVRALDANDAAQATKLADQLSADHAGSGYADQGQLALARLQVERNELPAALARLQKVLGATGDAELRPMVRLRVARLQLQQGDAAAAIATLDGGGNDLGAWAARYADVRGDALLAKGDREGALKAWREAQAGASASGGDLLALKINSLAHP